MSRVDLTVLAIPGFVGAMVAEHLWQRKHPAPAGTTRAGDYELTDTIASLTMGVGSLVVPHLTHRVLAPLTPGSGRWARVLMGTGVAAATITTIGDVIRQRRSGGPLPRAGVIPDAARARSVSEAPLPSGEAMAVNPAWARLTGGSAVAAVGATALCAATTWAAQTSGRALFERSRWDLGTGPAATALALLGWDFLYYWNHRLSHESRWLWALHVVHHSSERYNLSTALRQPVAEGFTLTVPYGLLALAGVRPQLIENARSLNLLYQFWIHTEVINSIGALERYLNTPSHHRVHHGSNRAYLDRNHGSILIVWDRLFGTFEREGERPVYGLTRNIHTRNPLRIATHEWRDIARDIAGATTWSDRFSYLLRGPGWGYARRARQAPVPSAMPQDGHREVGVLVPRAQVPRREPVLQP